jgi:hypothetical protein
VNGPAFAVSLWVSSGVGALLWSMVRCNGFGEDNNRTIAEMPPAYRAAFVACILVYAALLGLVALALEIEAAFRLRALVLHLLTRDDFDHDFDDDES